MSCRFNPIIAVCALGALLLQSCSSTPATPLYAQETFDASSSPYAHTFPAAAAATCEASRRALLSQGYIATATQADAIDGSKNFQPNHDSHVVIEFHVVCADAGIDGTSSTAYVNAVQDRYTLKKVSNSASVGLSVLGSVSLPIGSSDDSLVKVGSETIPAGLFYERYFKLVDHFLKIDPRRASKASVASAEKEAVAPLPEPAPVHEGEPMKMATPVTPTPAAPAVPMVVVPGAAPVAPVVTPVPSVHAAVPAAASAVTVAVPAVASAPASAVAVAVPAVASTPASAVTVAVPAVAPAPASAVAAAALAPAPTALIPVAAVHAIAPVGGSSAATVPAPAAAIPATVAHAAAPVGASAATVAAPAAAAPAQATPAPTAASTVAAPAGAPASPATPASGASAPIPASSAAPTPISLGVQA